MSALTPIHLCSIISNLNEVMIALPADHYINNVSPLPGNLEKRYSCGKPGSQIITLGITPNRPETGYGYICQGDIFDTYTGNPSYIVNRFVEKPDYNKAIEYLSSGNFLWNSGMFLWRVDLISRLIEEPTPQLAEGLRQIGEALGSGRCQQVLDNVYWELPKISVDYGILEKADICKLHIGGSPHYTS